MQVRVFYSWQSELPEEVNRFFLRDVLIDAMRVIQREYGLDERPEVDHDTKGVPGLPDIVQTIFSKIEASSAFVADVSFTSMSPTKRLCANANVLIELGYALHSLGDERLIILMNEAFGNPRSQMPFNLAARRWPITYTLHPDADKETRKAVREELKTDIANALKTMANTGILFSTPLTSSSLRADRTLFAKFLQQFPSNGNMANFLRDHDLFNAFPWEWTLSIDRFLKEWSNSLNEFIDPSLSEKRNDLLEKLVSFLRELSCNVWPQRHNNEYLSMELDDFDDDSPRWAKRRELNDMATAAYEAHQELIRACKNKLGYPESS